MEYKVQISSPILGILGLVFITLKLCNVIAWSWWWVLAPFWVPVAVVGCFGIFVIALSCIVRAFQRGGF